MYCYVARQPIFDRQKAVTGYELLFRDGVDNCFPNVDADEATSKLITQHHLLLGVEKITSGKQAFINFSADTLIHHFPTSIDPKSMVIEILETVPISDELLTACKELHKRAIGWHWTTTILTPSGTYSCLMSVLLKSMYGCLICCKSVNICVASPNTLSLC